MEFNGKALIFGLVILLANGTPVFGQDEHKCSGLRSIMDQMNQLGPKQFDWASVPKEYYPELELLRHTNMFEQRRKFLPHNDFLSDDVEHLGLAENVTCALCSCIFDHVVDMFNNGTSVEDTMDWVENACKVLHIEEDPVCEGIVDVYGQPVYYMWQKMGSDFTGSLFCGNFVDEECFTPEDDALMNGWSVPLLGTSKPPYIPPAAGGGNVKVFYFTDVHLDLTYKPGTNEDCNMPCCCMGSTAMATENQTAAGPWGTYADCDVPLATLDQMFYQVSRDFGNQLTYAIYTGDSPAHDVWAQTKQSNFDHSTAVFDLFKAHFKDVPLYYTLGNHEGFPVNGFPTRDETNPDWEPDWIYNGIGTQLEPFLSVPAADMFKQNGFYAEKVMPGLKIISFNNNFGAPMNFFVWANTTDPAGQLQWLMRELQDSEDNFEKVHILTHHPNGRLTRAYETEFAKIVKRYERTVAGIFYGHTHSDSPEIWFSDDGQVPTFVGYINPSFTFRGDKAPEFRIYTFDGGYYGASYLPVQIDTYYTDIEKYQDPNVAPVWSKLYNTKSAYGMTGHAPYDWLDLLQRAVFDVDLYQKIVRYDEQNVDWVSELDTQPEDRRHYLCKMIYNVDPCPLPMP